MEGVGRLPRDWSGAGVGLAWALEPMRPFGWVDPTASFFASAGSSLPRRSLSPHSQGAHHRPGPLGIRAFDLLSSKGLP